MSQSWSSIRKRFEQDLLCEKLRGRVQYFRTIYHGAPDEYGSLKLIIREGCYFAISQGHTFAIAKRLLAA